MSLQSLPAPRFVRRTSLGWGEYRKNFRQVDCDVIAAVTSREADAVTPLMSKIYLRLINAPAQYWEREGVLRFEAELREEEGHVKAWDALCALLGVASATASKALRWMHERGVIGYFAGKNGAGIRVFINRASSSIGTRARGEKILDFRHASSGEPRASGDEAAFSDSFADLEVFEKNKNSRAPKNGAERNHVCDTSSASIQAPIPVRRSLYDLKAGQQPTESPAAVTISAQEIVGRLKSELEPCLREAAARAAAQSAAREMERTREWFETKALPKAVRVAQHEVYDLLRKHGGVEGRRRQVSANLGIDRITSSYTAARPLTAEEIRETAEICVAFLEAQGKSIEVTLSEISTANGGWLLPEDAPKVRELAESLARGSGKI